MVFEQLRDNILSLLTTKAAGRYDTHGSLVQSKGAGEVILTPRVSVYYQGGDFPKSASGMTSYIRHDATFRIEITVLVQHEADLSVLNDPNATPAERAAALAQLNNPDLALKADRKIDETWGIIWNILMSAIDADFDLKGDASDRWVDNFQKDTPGSFGEYMAISGSANFTAKIAEPIDEEEGTPATTIDSVIDIEGDQGDNLGVVNSIGG